MTLLGLLTGMSGVVVYRRIEDSKIDTSSKTYHRMNDHSRNLKLWGSLYYLKVLDRQESLSGGSVGQRLSSKQLFWSESPQQSFLLI